MLAECCVVGLVLNAQLGVGYAQGDEFEKMGVPVPVNPFLMDSLGHVEDGPPLPAWYDFVGNVPSDLSRGVSLSVETRTLPVLLGLTGLTLGLVATDHETYEATSGVYERSHVVSTVSDFFVSLGDGKSPLVLAGVFGAYGLVALDHRAIRTASQTLEALLATGLVVQTLKHITGRESPCVSTSNGGTWRPFPSLKTYHRHQSRYHAFPSGHIATTMAAVVIMTENYTELGWLKPVGYSIVGLVGISLVNNGWHWYSDLPLGIGIGYALGKIAAHPSDQAGPADPNEMSLSLSPMMNEWGNGVRFSLRL